MIVGPAERPAWIIRANLWRLNLPVTALFLLLLPAFDFCEASGYFEIQVSEFNNSRARLADGTCCRHEEGRSRCSLNCRTYFRVCLKEYQSEINTNGPCTFGNVSSDVLGGNYFVYSSDTSKARLTLRFEFAWTVRYFFFLSLFLFSSALQKFYFLHFIAFFSSLFISALQTFYFLYFIPSFPLCSFQRFNYSISFILCPIFLFVHFSASFILSHFFLFVHFSAPNILFPSFYAIFPLCSLQRSKPSISFILSPLFLFVHFSAPNILFPSFYPVFLCVHFSAPNIVFPLFYPLFSSLFISALQTFYFLYLFYPLFSSLFTSALQTFYFLHSIPFSSLFTSALQTLYFFLFYPLFSSLFTSALQIFYFLYFIPFSSLFTSALQTLYFFNFIPSFPLCSFQRSKHSISFILSPLFLFVHFSAPNILFPLFYPLFVHFSASNILFPLFYPLFFFSLCSLQRFKHSISFILTPFFSPTLFISALQTSSFLYLIPIF
ncbi:JAG1 [Acanthosepion pharaonis]|uniref:JAG1 n=1 Tax=Acanthosepion pharaonis TaxID=158019 RepID=A0A812E3V0_ACAPH|nr:JAG1 [Sepia pharaonis]